MGVRDTNKAAGSFLPHWHFQNPIRYWLYTGTDAPIATTGMIFVCEGGGESKGTCGGSQEDNHRKTLGKEERVLLKRRVVKVPL